MGSFELHYMKEKIALEQNYSKKVLLEVEYDWYSRMEYEESDYLNPDNLESENFFAFPKLGKRIDKETIEYYSNTKAEWRVIASISREQVISLKREADYISFSKFDSGVLPGSLYFYHKGGVVRISDHYLERTSDCDWKVKIKGSKETFEIKTKKSLYVVAYCKWEDFKVNHPC